MGNKKQIESLLRKASKKIKKQGQKIRDLEFSCSKLLIIIEELKERDSKTKVKFRSATSTELENSTWILQRGEPCIEFPDDGIGAPKIKIGDGKHLWKDLEYLIPENSVSKFELFKKIYPKEPNINFIIDLLGISKTTFYRYKKKYEETQ